MVAKKKECCTDCDNPEEIVELKLFATIKVPKCHVQTYIDLCTEDEYFMYPTSFDYEVTIEDAHLDVPEVTMKSRRVDIEFDGN